MRSLALLIGGVALLAATGLTYARVQGNLPAELLKRGWEEVTFDDKRANRFATCGDGCIKVETTSSVSMIGRPVTTDLTEKPVLTWEWKIEKPVTPSDLTTKGEDDRAVAVYVTFPFDPDTASFGEKLLRPMVELARGADAPSRVISYVWGGFGETGQLVESPFFGGVNAMIISRTQDAPVGDWVTERFNIVADHKRAFGFEPKTAAHVLISADSDDTGADNQAYVRKLMFGVR